MKSKVKEKKTRPTRGLVSDGTGSPNTAAPSMSGTYIQLAQKGKLQRLFQLRKKLAELESDVRDASESLSACNNPNWLDRFARAQGNKGRQFKPGLEQHAVRLEKHKAKLLAQKDNVLSKIHGIVTPAPEGVFNSLATPFADMMLPGKIGGPDVGPKTNIPSLVRDLTIKKHERLRNKELCKRLDYELQLGDLLPIGFPERWYQKFGVKTFAAAYANPNCKNLVQKLISEAKGQF